MHYLNKFSRKNGEDAVSPVVGVMLMLVVTIIIAAVVSAFAGGLIGGASKSPSLSMDVRVVNTGTYMGSGFFASVTGVSDAVSTKDLKIVTAWKTTNRTDNTPLVGGNTSIGGITNSNCWVGMKTTAVVNGVVPYGYGSGISGSQDSKAETSGDQFFGNYSLIQGTTMGAYPYGSASGTAIGGYPGIGDVNGYGVTTAYNYNITSSGTFDTTQIDPAQAVLGTGWENLRAGDTVNVKVIYIPSGQTIYQKAATVTGA
ncbi:MAG: type IV pilin N-terminal domain-containing protein [Methanoregula sp.]|jgi:FlaG/FlaF family flagellin (archaellin)